MVEVMVAGLIFSIAAAGVFAALGSIKKPVTTSDKALQASYCGQQVLETLRARVDERDWDSGTSTLSIGSHTINAASSPSISSFTACSTTTFAATSVIYDVSAAADGTRKVTADVNW